MSAPGIHACTLGWPEIPSDAVDNLCGALGRSAEHLTEDLGQVTCADCLRAIAEWGLHRAQVACGLALQLGRLQVERDVLRADLDGTLELLGPLMAERMLAKAGVGVAR